MCNRNRMFFLSAFLQFFVVSRALQLKKALLCFKYAQMCRHLTHIFRYVVCYVISMLCVVYDKLFFHSFSLNLLVCACSTTPGTCLSLSAFNGTHQTNHTTNERWHSKFSYGKVFLSFFNRFKYSTRELCVWILIWAAATTAPLSYTP